MKRFINTWRTYTKIPLFNEHYDPDSVDGDKSLTVPDMTFSIATLLERYTRSQELPFIEGAGYESEDEVPLDLPDLEKMDKMEKLEYASELREVVEEGQERRKKRKAEVLKKTKAKAKAKAKAEDDIKGTTNSKGVYVPKDNEREISFPDEKKLDK
ncbi:hypothetical protein [Microviridae sp.]|nr:hypothetical protein [Microviridae sp.]